MTAQDIGAAARPVGFIVRIVAANNETVFVSEVLESKQAARKTIAFACGLSFLNPTLDRPRAAAPRDFPGAKAKKKPKSKAAR
jgi:hypothetical protein